MRRDSIRIAGAGEDVSDRGGPLSEIESTILRIDAM